MPVVRDLSTRYAKYMAKMDPDRVSARYEAVKQIAISRYLEGVAPIRSAVESVKALLDSEGVPAGDYALYISFAETLLKRMRSYNGATFMNVALGLKQYWINKGADPLILDKVIALITGTTPK